MEMDVSPMDVSPIIKIETEEHSQNDDDKEEESEKSPITFFLALRTEVSENEDEDDTIRAEDEETSVKEILSTSSGGNEVIKAKSIEIQVSPTKIFEKEEDSDDEDDDEIYEDSDVDPLMDPLQESEKKHCSSIEIRNTEKDNTEANNKLEDFNNSANGNLTGAIKKEEGGKKTVEFPCEFCPGVIFSCSKTLTKHRRTKHPDSQRIVEVEPNKFLYDDTWGFFLSANGPDKVFTCGTCFVTQKHISKICRHIDYLHKNVPRPLRSPHISSQIQIHNGSTICPECGHKYSTRQIMLSHLRLHNRERTIICPVPNCGQRFHYNSNLKFHMRIHATEKANKCSVCEKTFSIKGDLREHEMTHIVKDPKPWKCPIEGSKFAWKKGLIEHIKKYHPTNGEVEKFECPFENCDKTFVAKSNYTKHVQSHELKLIPKQKLQCDICDTTTGKKLYFKTPSGLERHQNKMHNNNNSNDSNTISKSKKRIRKVGNERIKKIAKKNKLENDMVNNLIKETDVEMIKVDVDVEAMICV